MIFKTFHQFIYLQDPPAMGDSNETMIGGGEIPSEAPQASPKETLEQNFEQSLKQGQQMVETSIQAMKNTFLKEKAETAEENPFSNDRKQVQWTEQIQQGNPPLDIETPEKIEFQKTLLQNLNTAIQGLIARIQAVQPALIPSSGTRNFADDIKNLFSNFTKAKALALTKEMKDYYDTLQTNAQKINISY